MTKVYAQVFRETSLDVIYRNFDYFLNSTLDKETDNVEEAINHFIDYWTITNDRIKLKIIIDSVIYHRMQDYNYDFLETIIPKIDTVDNIVEHCIFHYLLNENFSKITMCQCCGLDFIIYDVTEEQSFCEPCISNEECETGGDL